MHYRLPVMFRNNGGAEIVAPYKTGKSSFFSNQTGIKQVLTIYYFAVVAHLQIAFVWLLLQDAGGVAAQVPILPGAGWGFAIAVWVVLGPVLATGISGVVAYFLRRLNQSQDQTTAAIKDVGKGANDAATAAAQAALTAAESASVVLRQGENHNAQLNHIEKSVNSAADRMQARIDQLTAQLQERGVVPDAAPKIITTPAVPPLPHPELKDFKE